MITFVQLIFKNAIIMSKKNAKPNSPQATTKSNTAPIVTNVDSVTYSNFNLSKYLSLFYIIILSFISYLVYQHIFDTKIHLGGDNAAYFTLSRSLANGHGYASIITPPDANGVFPSANHFPPGYSFILAIYTKLFSDNIVSMTKFNGVFLWGSVLLVFLITKKLTQNIHLSAIIALICLVNGHLLHYSTIMMSEVPYMFFSLLALFSILQIYNKKDIESHLLGSLKDPYLWLTVFAVVAGFYIRTAGIGIFLGFLVLFLSNKKWYHAALFTLLFIAAILPWQMRSAKLGGNTYVKALIANNPYYVGDMGPLGTRLLDSKGNKLTPEAKNISKIAKKEFSTQELWNGLTIRFIANVKRYVSSEIPNGILPYTTKLSDEERLKEDESLLGLLFLALMAFGWWHLKEHRLLFFLVLGSAFGILLLWPQVWFGIRFVLPVIPLFLILICFAIYKLIDLLTTKIGLTSNNMAARIAAPLLLAFLFIPPYLKKKVPYQSQMTESMYTVKGLNIARKQPHSPNFAKYFEMAEYCKASLPKTVFICTRKADLFYTKSERYSGGFAKNLNSKLVLDNLIEKKYTHVVIDQLGFNDELIYLIPVLQKYPQMFKLIKEIPTGQNEKGEPTSTYLFEILKDQPYQ
jgi:hypothetical protein